MREASEVKLQRTSFNNIKYLLIWTFWKSIPLAHPILQVSKKVFFHNRILAQRTSSRQIQFKTIFDKYCTRSMRNKGYVITTVIRMRNRLMSNKGVENPQPPPGKTTLELSNFIESASGCQIKGVGAGQQCATVFWDFLYIQNLIESAGCQIKDSGGSLRQVERRLRISGEYESSAKCTRQH